jgi:mycothiol synthase
VDEPRRIPAEHRADALLWCDAAEPPPDGAGDPVRHLDELRRPLPLEPERSGRWTGSGFRPYRPGADDAGLLAVNNRAFHWHADQGGWDIDDLTGRTSSDWFRPEDLLVHDADDGSGIDGFCWTRFHPAGEDSPALGEIFAIATDPDRPRRGLGRALAVAGLDHQSRRGATVAMLYVERDNTPAQRLYESMGFTLHRRQLGYTAGGLGPAKGAAGHQDGSAP